MWEQKKGHAHAAPSIALCYQTTLLSCAAPRNRTDLSRFGFSVHVQPYLFIHGGLLTRWLQTLFDQGGERLGTSLIWRMYMGQEHVSTHQMCQRCSPPIPGSYRNPARSHYGAAPHDCSTFMGSSAYWYSFLQGLT